MGLKSYLQSRRDDAELGKGIWRRSHDRFIRGIDRFHQVLERLAGTESSASMIELIVPDANELADLIPRVRAVAMEAHRLAPSDGDILAIRHLLRPEPRPLQGRQRRGPLRRGPGHGPLLRRVHHRMRPPGERAPPR